MGRAARAVGGPECRQRDKMSVVEDLRAFFHSMPVALYRTNRAGELVAGNQALADLLGYDTVEELLRKSGSVEDFYVHPEQRLAWLERIGENGAVVDFDIELRGRDGATVWVRDAARTVRDQSGAVWYEGALIDVTDKIRAQRERDEFVATVSHELRNPLAAMLGLSSELAEHYDTFSDEERREMAQLIACQAEDASWIIEDLLVLYRDEMDRLNITIEDLEVSQEVERVLGVVDRPVEVRLLDGVPMVRADPRRLRQILRNLVSNADRYGGDQVRVTAARVGDRVEIRVEDSGEPIPEAEVERLFKPYQRGSGPRHANSVGLGLAVARRLARMMDGDLVYRHQEGWSSFVVSLPSA